MNHFALHLALFLALLLGLILKTVSFAVGFVLFPVTLAHYGLQCLSIYLIEKERKE